MNEETVKQIQEALAPVAEAIKTGAEVVYEAYHKQVILDGIIQIVLPSIMFLVCLLIAWIICLSFRKSSKKADLDLEGSDKNDKWREERNARDAKEEYYTAIATSVIIMMLLSVLLSMLVAGGIKRLINPTYYVVQEIVSTAKGE